MQTLKNKRILVTQCNDFMGPAICEKLTEKGADLIASPEILRDLNAPKALVDSSGELDALIVNLAAKAPSTPLGQVEDDEWRDLFETMVDPLPRLVGAVLPVFKRKGGGKIVVVGSAAALRGMARRSSYSAARGAQLAFVQAAGVELAHFNIQINAIAQNFVENPTYFPPEIQENPAFQERLKREVPLGRLVTAHEDTEFIAYLCSDAASCFVGQVFPVSGGWAIK